MDPRRDVIGRLLHVGEAQRSIERGVVGPPGPRPLGAATARVRRRRAALGLTVGRLPIVDPDDPNADPEAAQLLQLVRGGLASGGLPWTDINVYSTMANHPQALSGLLAFGQAVYTGGSLTPAHRELAYLGASLANDCHY